MTKDQILEHLQDAMPRHHFIAEELEGQDLLVIGIDSVNNVTTSFRFDVRFNFAYELHYQGSLLDAVHLIEALKRIKQL